MIETANQPGSHDHALVLDVNVSAVNMNQALDLAVDIIEAKQPGYVCVTGVHGVMEAREDREFLQILNKAALNLPDGMPMSWMGWWQGHQAMNRVYGPDFMIRLCEISVAHGYRHFFYGGNEGVADLLARTMQERFPGLQVAGTYYPPFRPLTDAEERDLLGEIAACKPHILWVGLSTPKQERFMSKYCAKLNVPLLVGVGAAFDMNTGRTKDAPAWMKRSGLQWLHRLVHEPKRLARRYLINNPKFIVLALRQILSRRMTPPRLTSGSERP